MYKVTEGGGPYTYREDARMTRRLARQQQRKQFRQAKKTKSAKRWESFRWYSMVFGISFVLQGLIRFGVWAFHARFGH